MGVPCRLCDIIGTLARAADLQVDGAGHSNARRSSQKCVDCTREAAELGSPPVAAPRACNTTHIFWAALCLLLLAKQPLHSCDALQCHRSRVSACSSDAICCVRLADPLAPRCVNEIGTFVLSTVFCASLYRSYCFFANEVGSCAYIECALTRRVFATNEQECALVFPTMQMGKYTPLRERLPQSVYLAMYRGIWTTVRRRVLVVFVF